MSHEVDYRAYSTLPCQVLPRLAQIFFFSIHLDRVVAALTLCTVPSDTSTVIPSLNLSISENH